MHIKDNILRFEIQKYLKLKDKTQSKIVIANETARLIKPKV